MLSKNNSTKILTIFFTKNHLTDNGQTGATMQIDFVDSGKRELDDFIDGEYLFLDTPTMENIDDDTQCGHRTAESTINTGATEQPSTGEEKVHF